MELAWAREEGCLTDASLLESDLKNWVMFTEVRTAFSSLLNGFANFIVKFEMIFEVFTFLWKFEYLTHGERLKTLIWEA